MELWILKPIEDLPYDDNPWEPWYDKCFGVIVRAKSEIEARTLANWNSGDENRDGFSSVWLNKKYTTCKKLESNGTDEIIMQDFIYA